MSDAAEMAFLVAGWATVAMNAAIVVADLVPARFVLDNSAEVGLRPQVLPVLAALKGLGAVGVAVGILWFPTLGILASAGLVAFYVGAVAAHVRNRVFHNIAFPAVFLATAITAFVAALIRISPT